MAFRANDRTFSLASFVDNLLSTGRSPEAAIAILQDCEDYVSQHWGLKFGDESKEFMVWTLTLLKMNVAARESTTT